jgi:hypothetical protein
MKKIPEMKVQLRGRDGKWIDISADVRVTQEDGNFVISTGPTVSFWRYPLTWLLEWFAMLRVQWKLRGVERGRLVIKMDGPPPGAPSEQAQWN